MSIGYSRNQELFTAIQDIFSLDSRMLVFQVQFETLANKDGGLRSFFGFDRKKQPIRCIDVDTDMFSSQLANLRNMAVKAFISEGWAYWEVSDGTKSFWCAKKGTYQSIHLYRKEEDFILFLKAQLKSVQEHLRLLEEVLPVGVL